MTALSVLAPGLRSTIQDFGRFGLLAQGVPAAGALDPVALRLANALVGNPPGEAGLEVAGFGPKLRLDGESALIAVVGRVRLSLERDGETRRLESERAHLLAHGDVLSLGAVEGVAMLAVAGGFDLVPVLGGLSTFAPARIGPLGGGGLSQGSALPLRRERAPDMAALALAAPFDYGSGPIRVVLGPQEEAFAEEAVALFLSSDYQVGREADRMGLRLDGPRLAHRDAAGIPSEGLAWGSVQVPGDGRPIILLADRQTLGGYAKIATVITAELPRLGRLVPGQTLRFKAVGLDEARAARLDLERRVKAAMDGLVPAEGGLDLAALYAANLVSGMVSGDEP